MQSGKGPGDGIPRMTRNVICTKLLEGKTGVPMPEPYVIVERHNGVLKLTLNDPTTRNALGPDMVKALFDELDRFEKDPNDRVLLLTGQDPSFCSGANVRRFDQQAKERQEQTAGPTLPWGAMEASLGKRSEIEPNSGALMPLRLHRLQKPSIAAVNGHAIGVGMGLALACDIRVASEKASFSEAFVRMGLVPGDGSCWQLPRLIGLSHTFLLQYTGDRIDGAEAYRIGLVSKLYPHDQMMREAEALALRIAQGPTFAISLIKYLVHKSLDTNLEQSLELANAVQEKVRDTEDHREAVRAFLEKRPPNFKGK